MDLHILYFPQPRAVFRQRDSQRRFSRRLSATDMLATVEKSLAEAAHHALQLEEAALNVPVPAS